MMYRRLLLSGLILAWGFLPGFAGKYATVRLTSDLSKLSAKERRMIPLLIEAAQAMDEIFWKQAYGDRDELLARLVDPELRRFARINYGPWDRLEGNRPFVPGFGAKPKGANFYPDDMTEEEFNRAANTSPARGESFRSLYTLIVREEDGRLSSIPYHEAFPKQLKIASDKLMAASNLAEDPGLEKYLRLRAKALLTDDFLPSDIAWMEMKNNKLDVVIGPIETYEDQLFGYKASYEAYVLIKDLEWSERLAKYSKVLPELQMGLPVPEKYKQEKPAAGSDLNVYDVVYYAGECNSGSKTIAINLPNDEEVQLLHGTRRLQLKNAMRAKFDTILVPIAKELVDPEQRGHITFDAFFTNTMFHEVAHGLGIKNTITGKGTVRKALKKQASALEEGKADVLGLYMITRLNEKGEFGPVDIKDFYVTFMTSVFRSIRFGAASAHGRANLARFNFFKEMNALTRDAGTGTYKVHFDRMTLAMNSLSEKILRFQGDGDYEGVAAFMKKYGNIGPDLRTDLDRLSTQGIPVDIVFQQGISVLKEDRSAR